MELTDLVYSQQAKALDFLQKLVLGERLKENSYPSIIPQPLAKGIFARYAL